MSIDHLSETQKAALLQRSRRFRREPTDAERRLWRLLRNRQLGGAKFRRQHQYGPYVLDFYCAEHYLAVEADGGQHFEPAGIAHDLERTRFLEARGVRVLRFTNRDILQESEGVLEMIQEALRVAPSTSGTRPHPNPLPRGEGTGASPLAGTG